MISGRRARACWLKGSQRAVGGNGTLSSMRGRVPYLFDQSV